MILDRQRDDLFVAIWICEVTLHVSPHKYLNLAPDLAQVLILDPEVSCLEGGGGRKEPLVKLSFNFVKVFTWVAAPSLLCNFIYELLADKRIVSQLSMCVSKFIGQLRLYMGLG